MLLVMVGLLFYMRAGHIKATGIIFLTFTWVLITLAIPSGGGIRGATLMIYPTIILMAGMLLGGRAIVGYTLASLVAGSVFFTLELNEMIELNLNALAINRIYTSIVPNIIAVAALVFLYDRGFKQMLNRTQAVTAQQNAVLDSAAMGITFLVDRKFVWVNQRMEEIFGYTSAELESQTSEILYPSRQDYVELGEEAYPILAQGERYYAERQMKRKDGSLFWCTFAGRAINADDPGEGAIWMLEDITWRKETEKEHERLQQEVIEAQQLTLKELSTPIIPIMDQVIVMPLVGSIDTMRARDITRSLLAGISEHQARVVILDITGVAVVDTGVANHLNKTIQAAQLKGAKTIVTGISDAVAESIVDLGIDWSNITTLSDLQTGLVTALNSMGIKLSQ
jgi:PAS domain S-box-containing protein